MKKLLLPLIGASLITMFSAFTCDGNMDDYDYDDGIASDTVVKDTTDTVKVKIIKDKEAEQWSD